MKRLIDRSNLSFVWAITLSNIYHIKQICNRKRVISTLSKQTVRQCCISKSYLNISTWAMLQSILSIIWNKCTTDYIFIFNQSIKIAFFYFSANLPNTSSDLLNMILLIILKTIKELSLHRQLAKKWRPLDAYETLVSVVIWYIRKLTWHRICETAV